MRAVVEADRRRHILDGDRTGGGHRGGVAGDKGQFPAAWDDERIICAIEGVANDATARRESAARERTIVYGLRDGVAIVVVIGADGCSIVTAFPNTSV